MANDTTIHIAVSRTAVCLADPRRADRVMPSRPHRDARMLKEDKHSVRQWVSLSINPREHSTSQLLSEAARNTSLSVTWLAFPQNAFAAVRQTDRLYRDFSTQIPSVPVCLFTLRFRHEVLHGERAAFTCKPNFRHVRRKRLPQVSARITSCRVPQSSLGGLDDPCLSLNEISSFIKNSVSYRDCECLSFSY